MEGVSRLLLYIIPPRTQLLTKINNLTEKIFFIFDGFKNEFIAFAKELKIELSVRFYRGKCVHSNCIHSNVNSTLCRITIVIYFAINLTFP